MSSSDDSFFQQRRNLYTQSEIVQKRPVLSANTIPQVPANASMHHLYNVEQNVAPLDYNDDAQKLTLTVLLRQTGLGIKVRFLLALILIAVFPAIFLILLLGDPSGQQQHATLARTLSLQSQAQTNALEQTFSQRTKAVARLGGQPVFAQPLTGNSGAQSRITVMLQSAQQVDLASVGWMVVGPDGTILASSNAAQWPTGSLLARVKTLSQAQQLSGFAQKMVHQRGVDTFFSHDTHISGGWMAVAVATPAGVLLSVVALRVAVQNDITLSSGISHALGAVLDQYGTIIAASGAVSNNQIVFTPAPAAVEHVLKIASNSQGSVIDNPLTGDTDVAFASPLSAIHGQYVVFAPQDTIIASNAGSFLTGRNTPLLILAIVVLVVLVATWVALPIVRPIRRATREIGFTTEDVRTLAENAHRIASEQALGTQILSGASKRLSSRRQSIIRDGQAIAQMCIQLQPRLNWIYQFIKTSSNRQALEITQSIMQGLQQIHTLGNAISGGLQNDHTLDQLEGAMKSATEISEQFEMAGEQLERGAGELEVAARTLL